MDSYKHPKLTEEEYLKFMEDYFLDEELNEIDDDDLIRKELLRIEEEKIKEEKRNEIYERYKKRLEKINEVSINTMRQLDNYNERKFPPPSYRHAALIDAQLEYERDIQKYNKKYIKYKLKYLNLSKNKSLK